MTAPELIHQLVQQFQDNLETYRSPRYNETETRTEFIDKFFKALGWDVYNEHNRAAAYKDVVREETLPVEGAAKMPDYTFRIGGTRKFFVEAKKPAVKIETDIHPAYQLRRYAWSNKLPLSVLTDFEEFSIYDCRLRPNKDDKATRARMDLFRFTDYIDKWDDIAGIFSKEAIERGAFDKYAESTKGKKGVQEVDDAFLDEIERWRELLAKNIALRNENLSVAELNYAVQMTIDRIVFLRICEDRGIEPQEQLRNAIKQPDVYRDLAQLFQRADGRYNSGLFHFRHEKDEPSAEDALTPGLHIDNKPLQDILKNLYYPDCPYVFSEIPPDILGQVYEQFLGKVVHLTPAHQARIEDKPEVRKAGGVYYTPTYIVDYIVRNTLGKLLEGKTPKEAAQLKVLDPACGSGTFLIGAYQYLLDWHLKWYIENDPSSWAKGKTAAVIYRGEGDWQLTISKKKEILLNNIFAVDIDPQAVEVAKLSLLLKVVQNPGQLDFTGERILPDLGRNIQCGNSLIGPDYFESRSPADDEERLRVNPFDWHAAFPQVFAQGGFDVVIGNPPYVRIQILQETSQISPEVLKERYISANKGNYDIYVAFVERGLELLSIKGELGFILPHKFFNAQYGEALRNLIAQGRHLAKVVHFGDQQVFKNATTYTCLLFLDKSPRQYFEFERVRDLGNWHTDHASGAEIERITEQNLSSAEWNFAAGAGAPLFQRLSSMPVKLEDVTLRIFQGLKTSGDKVYIVEQRNEKGSKVLVYSPEREAEYWLEGTLLHPLIKGGDSKRYKLTHRTKLLLFPYAPHSDGRIALIPQDTMEASYPLTWQYLLSNKAFLENREQGRMKGPKWYGYIYPKNFDVIRLPKIFTPDIAAHSSFSLDETGDYYFTGGAAGGYGILVKPDFSREYILGLLNSRLLEWYLHQIATVMRGEWYSYESRFIHSLPIHTPTLSKPSDKASHDKMVSLVERMLELHKQHPNTPHEQEALAREIRDTDSQIDRLVYELYGLTGDEIGLVEGRE